MNFSSSSSDDSDQQTPNIRRRNSIATAVVVPTLTTTAVKPRHCSSFPIQNGVVVVAAPSPLPSLDFELISLNTTSSHAYTSLKDLIPGAAAAGLNSPRTPTGAGGSEIYIRNRLVKQAAWAYLQPMSTSPSCAGPRFFRSLWLRFSSQNVVASVLGFINRAVDRLLRALGFINHR